LGFAVHGPGIPAASPRSQRQPHPPAACRALLGAGELTFKPTQPGPFLPGQARDVQQFPSGQSRADRDAPVDADGLAVIWGGNRRGDGGESEVPAPGSVSRHPVRFRARGYGARPAEPNPACLRYPDLTVIAAESAHLARFDGDDPESLVPARLAPRRPLRRIRPVEGRCYRLGEVPQRLLLHYLTARTQPVMFRTDSGKLPTLLQIARRALPSRMPVRVLLDGKVPHVPGVRAMVPQYCLLGGCKDQPVSRHANTLSTGTDIFWGGDAAFPGLKARVSTLRS